MYYTLYWAPNFPALFWILSTTDEIGDILFLTNVVLYILVYTTILVNNQKTKPIENDKKSPF